MTTKAIQTVTMQNNEPALRLDATALLDEVYICKDVPETIRETLAGVVTWQQRNETTLVRFLAGPRQFPAFAMVLLATCSQAQVGDAEMCLNTYFTERQSEKASAVLIPLNVPGFQLATARVGLTPAGEDIVRAAAGVTFKDGVVLDACLALSGVWQTRQWMSKAVESLVGKSLTDEAIQSAAKAVENDVDPISDYLGSAAYRRAMAGVLTRQVLEACKQGGQND